MLFGNNDRSSQAGNAYDLLKSVKRKNHPRLRNNCVDKLRSKFFAGLQDVSTKPNRSNVYRISRCLQIQGLHCIIVDYVTYP